MIDTFRLTRDSSGGEVCSGRFYSAAKQQHYSYELVRSRVVVDIVYKAYFY